MLLGFLQPTSGTIRIGGRKISEWSPAYLLRQIGYAPQNDHILEATVEENLSWAGPSGSIDQARMVGALKQVRLETKEPLEDVLKRKAQTLSLGQRQRLSAARMLLDKSNVLILDEPLAGVDVITMADIVPELELSWRQNRTTVVLISHKLVYASSADHVIILDINGRIIEVLGRQELSKSGTTFDQYRTLAIEQAGGFSDAIGPRNAA